MATITVSPHATPHVVLPRLTSGLQSSGAGVRKLTECRIEFAGSPHRMAEIAAIGASEMDRYDPLLPPAPEQWQAIDEQERILLVEDCHRRARIRVPNLKVHALFHVMVENQIALGDEIPVRRTLQRLMAEGLDRHDAIHAVGSVLAGHVNDLQRSPESNAGEDSSRAYYTALERLTAQEWRRSG